MKYLALRAFGYLNHVIAKLSLDWPLNFTHIALEAGRVEFRNHLARGKSPQTATVATRRATGMLLGQSGEICTSLYLIDQVLALGL